MEQFERLNLVGFIIPKIAKILFCFCRFKFTMMNFSGASVAKVRTYFVYRDRRIYKCAYGGLWPSVAEITCVNALFGLD